MIELIQQRLAAYRPLNALEEEHALKEILQEIALYGLWRGRFFETAAFRGGTSLRILHKLQRFSEDLDFTLKTPDAGFKWDGYLRTLVETLEQFGLRSQVLDRSRMDQSVRKALLKDDSIARQVKLAFYGAGPPRQLSIRIEIDVNPPPGSGFAYTYLDFPLDFEICHQDLGSNFALKIHALLCRRFLRGRDWYDFNWYVKQGVKPNVPHLQAALRQYGPWQGEKLEVSVKWLEGTLQGKVSSIDWQAAARDVAPFLNSADRESLSLWSEAFFQGKVERLAGILTAPQ